MPTIDEVLEAAVGEGRVPGVVAAAASSDSESLYLAAFGAAATEPYRPMAVDTVVRIASMTKLVTSVAVMMLVEEGRVDLEAPLARYVPGFRQPEVLADFDPVTGAWSTRPAAREATIRELMSHTAGYGYWWLHEPLRVVSGGEPNLVDPPFLMTDPGEGFAYSTSTDVAGQLIEPVSGLPLERFLEERLFAPLGMTDTGFRRPRNLSRLAHVHRQSRDGFRQFPLEARDNPPSGGTGLFSTAPDYLRLLRCLLKGGELDGERILDAGAAAEIHRNQIDGHAARMQRTALAERSNDFIFMDESQKFGFGVMIETRQHPGKRSIGSYGWGGIVNTWFWVDPARDIAAVLMMQMAPFACPPCVELLEAFERAVYEELPARETE